MISFARTKETVSTLVKILQQGGKVGEFPLDQEMRWHIIQKAMAWNISDANALLENEKQRDTRFFVVSCFFLLYKI
jgi:hypothetical protein